MTAHKNKNADLSGGANPSLPEKSDDENALFSGGPAGMETEEDTDAFLRMIANGLMDDDNDAPVNGSTAPSAPEVPSSTELGATPSTGMPPVSAQGGAPEQQQAEAQEKKGPVNPLVSARVNAAGNAVSQDRPNGSLYPISEVEGQSSSKSFDTSFGSSGKGKGPIIAIVAVLAVALIGCGIFFGWKFFQSKDASTRINEAIEQLRASDSVIMPLDAAVSEAIDTKASQRAVTDLINTSTAATSSISSAETTIDQIAANSGSLSDEDRKAVDALRAQVSARRSMLDVGRELQTIDAQYVSALSNLQNAYSTSALASDLLNQTWDLFNPYSEALQADEDLSEYVDPWHLVELDNQALAAIQQATDDVAVAASTMPSADLGAINAYLAAQAEYAYALLDAHTAFAEGDPDRGYEGADRISAAEAAMLEAQANVPADPAAALSNAYMSAIQRYTVSYDEAHSALTDSAAVLNGYVGVSFDDPSAVLSTQTVATPTTSQVATSNETVETANTTGNQIGGGQSESASTEQALPSEGETFEEVPAEEGGEEMPAEEGGEEMYAEEGGEEGAEE